MTIWNVETFIERFARGTLGRKTQYSSYHVVKFDACHILVNRNGGRRGTGEQPLGVYFGPDLTLFNQWLWPGLDNFQPEFSCTFPENIGDITDSGLLDIEPTAGNEDVKSILIQLGHRQFLIEPYWAIDKPVSYEDYFNNPYDSGFDLMQMNHYLGVPKYGFIRNPGRRGQSPSSNGAVMKPLPEGHKFETVKDARIGLVPQAAHDSPDKSFQYLNFWFAPVFDYKPEELSPEEIKVLENPPLPWQYDLTTMSVYPPLLGTNSFEGAVTNNVRTGFKDPFKANILRYIHDKAKYEEAVKKLKALYFNQDAGNDFDGFYIMPASSDAGVQKTDKPGIYYVKGAIFDKVDGSSLSYGIDKLFTKGSVKNLNDWHLMVKEF